MKKLFELLVAVCVFSILAPSALAQTAPSNKSARPPCLADCDKAGPGKKADCEGYNKALLACVDAFDPVEHLACMEDNMPPPDCSKASDKKRCAEVTIARAACKGKHGAERTKCMKEKAQPPAKTK